MDGRERSPELMVGLREKSVGGCCLEIAKLDGDLGMAVVSRAFLWVCCCCLCSSGAIAVFVGDERGSG